MEVELGREPTGETINLRELLEQDGRVPVTIGNEHGPWYVVLSSIPDATHPDQVNLEVQFPDGGLGLRNGVPLDQDVEVFE